MENNKRNELVDLAIVVSSICGISTADIFREDRHREITDARKIVSHIATNKMGIHPEDTGRFLGITRSQVLYNIKTLEDLIQTQSALKNLFKKALSRYDGQIAFCIEDLNHIPQL